jgi:hypothetical protein
VSKKPARSRHRIPACALQSRLEPISERYQTEVDMSTTRLEQRYRRAQKALEAAEQRAATTSCCWSWRTGAASSARSSC